MLPIYYDDDIKTEMHCFYFCIFYYKNFIHKSFFLEQSIFNSTNHVNVKLL